MSRIKNRPIGIFDSGVGGLTVAQAIKQALPGESIIYFGDTAHLPYGDKSAQSIVAYSRKITEFLLGHDAKAVLVACNSASASAYEILRQEYGSRILVMDVIDPVVEYLCSKSFRKIAVIGTKRTIDSGTYEHKVAVRCPGSEIVSVATPLFVPMIEEGFIFDDISNAIIRAYMSNIVFNDTDALVLGCTHYPIIRNQIAKYFNFNIEIVDSARIVSQALRKAMAERGLLESGSGSDDLFFVSDYTPWFEKIARMFFEGNINLTMADIWA